MDGVIIPHRLGSGNKGVLMSWASKQCSYIEVFDRQNGIYRPEQQGAHQLMELKGTHGTCISFAEEIIQNGFKMLPGRRGTGAYFWSYTSTLKDYATNLAQAWWSQAKSFGQYNAVTDPSCKVLFVTIQAEDDLFLDLEEHKMKQMLSVFLNDSFKRSISLDRAHLADRSYDLFVNLIERKLGKKFQVIHVTVNPPKKEHFANYDRMPTFDLMGMPSCYVVKDNKHIILNG